MCACIQLLCVCLCVFVSVSDVCVHVSVCFVMHGWERVFWLRRCDVCECLCACALNQTGARSADDKSALRGE